MSEVVEKRVPSITENTESFENNFLQIFATSGVEATSATVINTAFALIENRISERPVLLNSNIVSSAFLSAAKSVK